MRSLHHFLIGKDNKGQSMTLVCLEGPGAVGKSTTSKALVEQYAAYVVPERLYHLSLSYLRVLIHSYCLTS